MGELDLAELQKQPVKDVQAAMPALSREQLTELLALEADSGQPRETLTKALVAQIEKLDGDNSKDPENEPPPPAQPEAKPTAPATDDFRHPDYRGALTCEQANWRNLHLKPGVVKQRK